MIAALYTLIFVLLEMSCEDQSLSHSRSKEVVAIWILQSSSLSIRQSSVTVLPRYLKECTFARCGPHWGYRTAHNTNKVQQLQNRAARILTGKYDYVNTRGIDLMFMCHILLLNVAEMHLPIEVPFYGMRFQKIIKKCESLNGFKQCLKLHVVE